jgi:hypothetical protein
MIVRIFLVCNVEGDGTGRWKYKPLRKGDVVQNIQILEPRISRFGGDAGFMVKYFLE